eukprot:jgi/Ulvmu1/307/UM001_0311.1
MDEFVEVIPEDTNEDEDFHEDLEPMLEEYRKSKQDKQARLEKKAAQDGRPFSAPVESPSCDSIRRRTEGDRALRDHPQGDSRTIYRPSSGSDKPWRSTSTGDEPGGESEAGMVQGHIEAALPAVPEEHMALGQAPLTCLPSTADKDLFTDEATPLTAPADSLDAGMDLDLAGLSLEDNADADMWSMPGPNTLPSLQSGGTTATHPASEHISNEHSHAFEQQAPLLDGNMHLQMLDQLESVDSHQSAGMPFDASEQQHVPLVPGSCSVGDVQDDVHDDVHDDVQDDTLASEADSGKRGQGIVTSQSMSELNELVQERESDHASHSCEPLDEGGLQQNSSIGVSSVSDAGKDLGEMTESVQNTTRLLASDLESGSYSFIAQNLDMSSPFIDDAIGLDTRDDQPQALHRPSSRLGDGDTPAAMAHSTDAAAAVWSMQQDITGHVTAADEKAPRSEPGSTGDWGTACEVRELRGIGPAEGVERSSGSACQADASQAGDGVLGPAHAMDDTKINGTIGASTSLRGTRDVVGRATASSIQSAQNQRSAIGSNSVPDKGSLDHEAKHVGPVSGGSLQPHAILAMEAACTVHEGSTVQATPRAKSPVSSEHDLNQAYTGSDAAAETGAAVPELCTSFGVSNLMSQNIHQAEAPPQAAQPDVIADLTNSKVVDRLVAFSLGQMGVEALLEGNVIGAVKFLFEAQQQGVNVVADTLRRAVTLALGTASSSSSTQAFKSMQMFLSDLIGLIDDAAKQKDVTELMLGAQMDRNLTEVPKALGALYQQSRVALQRMLHTEAQTLSGGAADTHRGGGLAAPGGLLPVRPRGVPGHATRRVPGDAAGDRGADPEEVEVPAEQRQAAEHRQADNQQDDSGADERDEVAQEVAGSGAGVAACACGRPLLLGTADGWLRVPTAHHNRARRTSSGKRHVHEGDQLPDHVQQHLEEAMQPDGADLEYVYLPGSSRPTSASRQPPSFHKAAPTRTGSYRQYAAGEFDDVQQPAGPPYVAADLCEDLQATVLLPVRRQQGSGLRPATAQPRRRAWDDSPAGAPPRSQHTAQHVGSRLRPQSAGQGQRSSPGHGVGGGDASGDLQALWDDVGSVQPQHPAAVLTGMQYTPYTQELLGRKSRQERPGDYFQTPSGSWYPAMAESPSIAAAWEAKGRPGSSPGAAHYPGGRAHDMQQVYAEQINEMLRYANQCAAALGLRYRYRAACRRPSSAMASRSYAPAAIEGYVERHIVSADGASIVHDPGQTKVLTYAKFAAVLEGLSLRVNSTRAFASPTKRSSRRKKAASKRKPSSSGQARFTAQVHT